MLQGNPLPTSSLRPLSKGKDFGRRSTLSYVCHSLGVDAAAFTHIWWLAPVVSIGSRASLGYGQSQES